uniref:Uncharacterized protein n=1 Tax=Rhizophora mucronata TaxID=61149 RepID=A0A2P2MM98_RHIMU
MGGKSQATMVSLLEPTLLSDPENSFINSIGITKRFRDTLFFLNASVGPCLNLRAFCFHAKAPNFFKGWEEAPIGKECQVHQA